MKTLGEKWISPVNMRLVIWVSFCAYLVVSFLGVNQSNLGVVNMSGQKSFVQSYSGDGVSLGYTRDIRSDEFLRNTPMLLGYLQNRNAQSISPLTIDTPFTFNIPSKISDYLIFPEFALSKFSYLPLAIKFSLLWWLPILLLFVSMILLGDALGNSRRITYLTFGLLLFAPGSAWWSNLAIPIFYNFLFAVFFLVRKENQSWVDKLAPILGGFFLARAISYYQPWALVLGSVVVLTGVVFHLKTRPLSKSIKIFTLMALSFTIFAIIRFLPHISSLRILLKTVYPGQRISTGGEQSFEFLFSTPFMWRLQFPGLEIANTNQSEIATWLILPGLLIFMSQIVLFFRNRTADPKITAGIAGGILATLWCVWGVVDFSPFNEYFLLVNRVPGFRAAQIVGSCFIFLLIFLYRSEIRVSRLSVWFYSLLSALLTTLSGLKIQKDYLPQITVIEILIVSTLVAVFVGGLVNSSLMRASRNSFTSLSLGFMMVFGVLVNPVNLGLGEFNGKISEKLVSLDTQGGGNWASHNFYSDALLISSGIKSISGQQSVGPNTEYWKILDPENLYQENWNRAYSYITFQWNDSDVPAISNPSPDVILISISPCSPLLRSLDLGYFISPKNGVMYTCATQLSEFQIVGQVNVINKVN